MANINNSAVPGKRGARGMKKYPVRIDMTPMVDLGFLLITFFVITARLSEPASLSLHMPKESGEQSTVGQSSVLTVLLNGRDVFFYNGDWPEAITAGRVLRTSLGGSTGLRQVIIDRQDYLAHAGIDSLGAKGLVLLIKAGPDTDYHTLVGLMDELLINNVTRHAIVKITTEELKFMQKNKKAKPE